LDLSYRPVEQTEGLNGVLVVKKADKKKNKFKIVTQEETIRLEADSPEERDLWIQVLVNETQGSSGVQGDDKFTLMGANG